MSKSDAASDDTTVAGQKQQERVHELARTFSIAASHHGDNPHANPFVEGGSMPPELDPSSPKFSSKAWMRQVNLISSRDPENYPSRTSGVSFRNLNVHGFSQGTDYQKNVANQILGIFGTFKGWFGVKSSTLQKIQILKEFEGLIESGELLVVLGRPGSGCSTFLKTIAGETHGFFVDSESELEYQGIDRKTMKHDFRGEVIYSAEVDVHFPMLTVGQTLEFAALARTPRNRFGVSRERYAEHRRDVVMAMFGLSHTLNTKVGNDFIRGVSGGERKRVSIAEAVLSGSPLQCWDNSTRGLDSATALEFIKTLKTSTTTTGSAALVAIYQASQSAYDLFDKVIVLYQGRQIYFGPTTDAKKFFTDMGFVCPDRQTTGDFLTSLTNPAERVVAPGFERSVPRTPAEFAQRWQESETRQLLSESITDYQKQYPVGGEALEKFRISRSAAQSKSLKPNSPYTISVTKQIQLCVKRGFQRLRGDTATLIASVFGNIFMSIIISTVFLNQPNNTSSFFPRGALLFYAILLNAFASALEMMTLYAQRPIVEKHAKYALYHPFSEAIASMLCDMPAKIVIAVFFNVILYFMTNLRREAGPFFIFFLFSFFTTLTMSNIFRTIASASKTLQEALVPAALFILALIVYTGFTIPTIDMVPWFRWLAYLNPLAYGFEALMVNEFHGRTFPCSQYVPAGPGYENVTGLQRVCSTRGSVPGSDTVSGTTFVEASYKYSYGNLWRNFGILVSFFAFFLITYMLAAEYISAAKSKGEVLVFRRGHMPRKLAEDDPEGGANDLELAGNEGVVVNENEQVAAIQRQTKIFHWKDVVYDIKIKKEDRRLLDHVDGWVKPGTLTALMGVSGAGKTTLLDVLATRTTMGVITGAMLVNGKQRDDSFQRKTGYVQQQDLHLATSTVREALTFSALLRQGKSIPREEKIAYVEEVIKLLEMEDYSEAIVGVPGEGLNVEQRKRLTIGVELAAKPELLLFFDEPTSGLDSQTAWSICKLMRKLANNGQAILCTIHQPSAILMQEFDRLLFLARGGKTVYFDELGPSASKLTGYFERNGAHPCPPGANPAEWMLEVIGAAPGSNSTIDWPEVWKHSPEHQAVIDELDRMEAELSQIEDNTVSAAGSGTFAVPLTEQYREVLSRVWQQYWRTPSYIYSKLILSTLTALFIGFSFFQAENSQQGLQNQLFSIFMLLTVFGNLVQQILPMFVTQRALYEARERPSKAYSWVAFMLAQMTVELPWQILTGTLCFVSWYYPIGLDRNAVSTDTVAARGGLMYLFILSFYIYISTFAHMAIAGIETADGGANMANLIFSFALIFCGVLVRKADLGWWVWMWYVSPFTYLVSGMLSTGVANSVVTCAAAEFVKFEPPSGQTCGQYMEAYIGFAGGRLVNDAATSACEFCAISETNVFLAAVDIKYADRWRNLGIVWIYIVVNIFGALGLYWLARVPKNKKVEQTTPATPDAKTV